LQRLSHSIAEQYALQWPTDSVLVHIKHSVHQTAVN